VDRAGAGGNCSPSEGALQLGLLAARSKWQPIPPMARIALGESASVFCRQPPLSLAANSETHRRPPLSQRGALLRLNFANRDTVIAPPGTFPPRRDLFPTKNFFGCGHRGWPRTSNSRTHRENARPARAAWPPGIGPTWSPRNRCGVEASMTPLAAAWFARAARSSLCKGRARPLFRQQSTNLDADCSWSSTVRAQRCPHVPP
jgi:hypothetical protein